MSPSAATEAALVAQLRGGGCVFAEDEARILLDAAPSADDLAAMARRRVDGEPLEVIVGWAEFDGLRISVEAGVFVPRRRTEFLVEQAAALGTPGMAVLDLCCGTGAVGIALLNRLGDVALHAADLDPVAVRCARSNLAAAGGRPEQVYQGDLFDPVPAALRGRLELLLVNAPYVPTEAIALLPPEARGHEPRVALDGGPDGVSVHRRIAALARPWLARNGAVLIETSQRQAPLTARCLASAGLVPRVTSSPDRQATVVIACVPDRA